MSRSDRLRALRLAARAAGAALYSPAPPYLVYFVTHRCNANCAFCFDYQNRQAQAESGLEELSLPEIEKIAARWKGLLQLTLTGGEPFMRDDLLELARAFAKAGVRSMTIATNGTMTDRAAAAASSLCGEFPALSLDLDLSVDGPPELHDRLRGIPGCHQEVMRTARILAPLQAERPGFRVGATLTLSALNQDTAPETLAALAESGLFRRVQVVYMRGATRDPRIKAAGEEAFRRCRRALDRLPRAAGTAGIKQTLASMVRNEVLRELEGKRRPPTCVAGNKFVTMDPFGTILPCEMLDQQRALDSGAGIEEWKMGALREHDYDIRDLLAMPEAKKIREWIVNSGCRCTFECAAYANLVFNPAAWPAVWAKWISGK